MGLLNWANKLVRRWTTKDSPTESYKEAQEVIDKALEGTRAEIGGHSYNATDGFSALKGPPIHMSENFRNTLVQEVKAALENGVKKDDLQKTLTSNLNKKSAETHSIEQVQDNYYNSFNDEKRSFADMGGLTHKNFEKANSMDFHKNTGKQAAQAWIKSFMDKVAKTATKPGNSLPQSTPSKARPRRKSSKGRA